MKNLKRCIYFLMITGCLTSCLSYREMVNFRDGENLGRDGGDVIPPIPALTVRPDDQLQVTINSYNQEEALRFNIVSNQSQVQLSAQGSNNATLADPLGYRVDSRGRIELPVIGPIPVAGLTLEQVRDTVHARVLATGYLKDLSVQVRFLSFRGESRFDSCLFICGGGTEYVLVIDFILRSGNGNDKATSSHFALSRKVPFMMKA